MSGQIRMSPEELKAKAKSYGDSSQQIEQILSNLRTLQGELRDQWEGRAFEAFDSQFIDLEPKVQSFAQLLEDIHQQLRNTADAVADHDEQLSRNFGLK